METFISHSAPEIDQAGQFRPEVWVETGEGRVIEIEPSTNGRAACVAIQAVEEGLKKPFKGWVGVDDDVFALAEQSLHTDTVLTYRIEWQRKPGIDHRIGVDELRGVSNGKANMDKSRENGVRKLVALGDRRGKEALTHPAEDPASQHTSGAAVTDDMVAALQAPGATTGQATTGQATAPTANPKDALGALQTAAKSHTLRAFLDGFVRDAIAAGVPAADVEAVVAPIVGNVGPGDFNASPNTRAIQEPPPAYPRWWGDNRHVTNIGSFEATSGQRALAWARRHLDDVTEAARAHNEAVRGADLDAESSLIEIPDVDAIAAHSSLLAHRIMAMADAVQLSMYARPDGIASRSARSHGIAVGYVCDAFAAHAHDGEAIGQAHVDAVIADATLEYRRMLDVSFGRVDDPGTLRYSPVSVDSDGTVTPVDEGEPAPPWGPPADAPETPARSAGVEAPPAEAPRAAPDPEPGPPAATDHVDKDVLMGMLTRLVVAAGLDTSRSQDVDALRAWLSVRFNVNSTAAVDPVALGAVIAEYQAMGKSAPERFRAEVQHATASAA